MSKEYRDALKVIWLAVLAVVLVGFVDPFVFWLVILGPPTPVPFWWVYVVWGGGLAMTLSVWLPIHILKNRPGQTK